MYYTYIIRCQYNSFYTGMTNNLQETVKKYYNIKNFQFVKNVVDGN